MGISNTGKTPGKAAFFGLDPPVSLLGLGHFRMGFLRGLMPLFCSAQPHRPVSRRSYRASAAVLPREQVVQP
jgi:hypothetical protein